MTTLANLQPSKGLGGRVDVDAVGAVPVKIGIYTLTFDNSYPTGGESISAIWDDFKSVIGINAVSMQATAANHRYFSADLTNKKLMAYTSGATQVADTHDETGVVALILVIGH